MAFLGDHHDEFRLCGRATPTKYTGKKNQSQVNGAISAVILTRVT